MFGRKLGSLLLQQCLAPQLWKQQCCWTGAACLSASAGPRATEAESTVPQQQVAGLDVNSSSTGRPRRRRRGTAAAPGHDHRLLTFDQLHDNIQQSLDVMNPLSQSKLQCLIRKAKTPEQIQATMSALRYNYMRRCRLQQFRPLKLNVLVELWQAGRKVGLDNSFAVQLLEKANSLGVDTSLGLCEKVLRACLQQKDYLAASRAWLYTKAYYGPSNSKVHRSTRRSLTCQLQFVRTRTAAQIKAAGSVAIKATAKPRAAGWASNNIIRLYLSGMSEWLKQGGLGYKHQQRLQQEVQQLADQLGAAGANVAWAHKVLQETADISSSRADDASEKRAGGDQPGDGPDKLAAGSAT